MAFKFNPFTGNLDTVEDVSPFVVGPASSTDNAVVRYDGTTGKLVQNSGVSINDSDEIAGLTRLDVDNLRLDGNTVSTTDTDGNLILNPNGAGEITASKPLILSADATQNLEAVTKQQLDSVLNIINAYSWQDSVIDKDLTAPPGSPTTGDRYLIGLDTSAAVATGAWAGQDGNIAEWNGSSWDFTAPAAGYHVTADDEDDGIYIFGGTTWEKKFFEATTASGFLSKAGFDIQLTNLVNQNLIVGNGSNVATSVNTASVGDIEADTTNGLNIKAGVIVDADINASAAITLSKLAALTADRALVSDASGVISASAVTNVELGHLSGVTSAIQTQLDAKLDDFSSSTDNALVRTDGTTGEAVQDSLVSLDDAGAMSGLTQLDVDNVRVDGNTISSTDTDGDIVLDPDGTGQVDVNANVVQFGETNKLPVEYVDSVSLLASQTGTVISELTMSNSFSGMILDYHIRDSVNGEFRTGTLYVSSDGTTPELVDTFSQSGGDTGIIFSVAMNGTDTEISYDSTDAATLRVHVKRFRA